jgi:hypothetical protein
MGNNKTPMVLSRNANNSVKTLTDTKEAPKKEVKLLPKSILSPKEQELIKKNKTILTPTKTQLETTLK